jgi:hypothetical protein
MQPISEPKFIELTEETVRVFYGLLLKVNLTASSPTFERDCASIVQAKKEVEAKLK